MGKNSLEGLRNLKIRERARLPLIGQLEAALRRRRVRPRNKCVRDGTLPDCVAPLFGGALAGDHRGSLAVAIFDDLQKVSANLL